MERSSLGCNGGLCKGSNHIGCECEFGKVHHFCSARLTVIVL